jgi:hypothetical protein
VVNPKVFDVNLPLTACLRHRFPPTSVSIGDLAILQGGHYCHLLRTTPELRNDPPFEGFVPLDLEGSLISHYSEAPQPLISQNFTSRAVSAGAGLSVPWVV